MDKSKRALSAKAYLRNYGNVMGHRYFVEEADFLTDRQRECLLRAYFDLENMAMIGEDLNMTRERVRQIANKAALKCRNRILRLSHILKQEEETNRKIRLLEHKVKVLTERLHEEEKPIPTIEEIDAKTIEDIDLSTRLYMTLKAFRIDTVGDIKKMKQEDFRQRRNVGIKSIRELKEVMQNLGILWPEK